MPGAVRSARFFQEKTKNMNKILCSTGALIGRPNGRDYRLLKLLPAAGMRRI